LERRVGLGGLTDAYAGHRNALLDPLLSDQSIGDLFLRGGVLVD
jgi:hypothetical protein